MPSPEDGILPHSGRIRLALGTVTFLLGIVVLRAALANGVNLFKTASLTVEVTGSVHLDSSLVLVYGPDPGVYYNGTLTVFTVTTLLGVALVSAPVLLVYCNNAAYSSYLGGIFT